MGESRSVTIPARYLEGSYESYTGCTILQIALPPEMALPGYVVEVPRFLTAEAPDGGLTVLEGKSLSCASARTRRKARETSGSTGVSMRSPRRMPKTLRRWPTPGWAGRRRGFPSFEARVCSSSPITTH